MSADPEARPASCREFVEDLTGRSTRKMPADRKTASGQPELWYLVFKDDEGSTHTVKGTVAGIRRSLREGVLGDASNVRASQTKDGDFQPLRSFPEFRDLVIAVAPMGASAGNSTKPAAAAKAAPIRLNQDVADGSGDPGPYSAYGSAYPDDRNAPVSRQPLALAGRTPSARRRRGCGCGRVFFGVVSAHHSPFPIDHINQHPQPAQVAAVEAEAEPGQRGQVRVVGLGGQGGGLLEGSGHDDVGELLANSLQERLRQVRCSAAPGRR